MTGAHCGRNRIRDLLWQDPFGQSDYGQDRVDSRYQLIKEVTDSDRTGVAGGKAVFGFWLATYFVTLKPHAGLLARGKGLEQGKVGIRRHCRPYPPSGRGLFLPAWQGGSDDLGVSLSTWVHVLTRESSTSNPSYLDADVSTRGPADTCDVFARVSTCCLHMNSLQPFSKIVRFKISNFEFSSPKKCLQMSHW